MTLIDCSELNIKPNTPGDRYAALSYAWGVTSPPSLSSGRLKRGQLPKTIQDAMFTITAIGLRFLWIDRFCLSQDDQTRREQILHMDQIYSHAEMTIVALKGDPSFGLPGVNGTLRRP
jgi:hypothetical protein